MTVPTLVFAFVVLILAITVLFTRTLALEAIADYRRAFPLPGGRRTVLSGVATSVEATVAPVSGRPSVLWCIQRWYIGKGTWLSGEESNGVVFTLGPERVRLQGLARYPQRFPFRDECVFQDGLDGVIRHRLRKAGFSDDEEQRVHTPSFVREFRVENGEACTISGVIARDDSGLLVVQEAVVTSGTPEEAAGVLRSRLAWRVALFGLAFLLIPSLVLLAAVFGSH